MKKLELVNRHLNALFEVDDDTRPVSYSPTQLSLRCSFPAMVLEHPEGPPGEESVELCFSLHKGTTRIELLSGGDGPVLEPAYLRQTTRFAPIGRYEIYQEDRILGGFRDRVVTYVFRADDGALVGVEDSGDSFNRYQFYRAVGDLLQVQYSLSKDFGDDFLEMDAIVTAFVRSLLVRTWET